jgi:hypothetical protein
MAHITKRTAARTDRTHDHKRGRPMAEAFPQIGTTGFFTDRMQMIIPQNLL